MARRTRFVLAALTSFAFAGCPASSPNKMSADAMAHASACETCVDSRCSKQQSACSADKACTEIVACVEKNSPCVGARASDPLCNDDCIKAGCALKYPDGVSGYAVLQQCQSGVQCGACNMACAKETSNMQCVADEVCDYSDPTGDSCKCSQKDGGVDAGIDAGANTPGGADDAGDCSANPSCALVSADVVNLALSKSITGPKMTSHTTSGQTLNLCHYDTPEGSKDVDPVDIAFGFPVSMKDFTAGRSTVMSPTTDLQNLGDAAFSYATGQATYGIHTVIVLVGCVQIEVSGSTSVDALVALAKKIIAKL